MIHDYQKGLITMASTKGGIFDAYSKTGKPIRVFRIA